MAKVRLPLYRLESKWAIAALIAGLLLAVALWAIWSWNDSRYFVSRNLLHQSRAAHLPLSIMLENAEARLAAVAAKPRHIRDGIVLGAADRAAEGIIVAPDIDLVSASLATQMRQAIANRRDGRPGLSLPFQLDGKWRAILATLDSDDHVLAATIELDRLSSLWTDIGEDAADSIAIATADGLIWWRRPMLDGLNGKDASKGPLFQAIRQSGALTGVSDIEAVNTDGSHRIVGWRFDPKYQLYVTFTQPRSAVLACWLGRFPFSLAIAIVLVLAALIMAVRASRSDRERVKAKKLADESEQRLANWARASADVFWETDTEHRLTHIRTVGEELEEGALDGLFGKTRWQLARVRTPKDHPEWQSHIVDLEARRAFKNFEYGIDTKTNGIVWVRCSGSPMFSASGEFLGYRGVTSDINK
jgi:PAS domain-containing protein